MQDFQTKRTSSRFGGRGTLVALLAIGVLGVSGFAAAGGLDLVQTWFITAEINGEPVELGDTEVTVETDGETLTLSIDVGNLEGDFEEGDEITITAMSGGDELIGPDGVVQTTEVVPATEQPDEDD